MAMMHIGAERPEDPVRHRTLGQAFVSGMLGPRLTAYTIEQLEEDNPSAAKMLGYGIGTVAGNILFASVVAGFLGRYVVNVIIGASGLWGTVTRVCGAVLGFFAGGWTIIYCLSKNRIRA